MISYIVVDIIIRRVSSPVIPFGSWSVDGVLGCAINIAISAALGFDGNFGFRSAGNLWHCKLRIERGRLGLNSLARSSAEG